MTWIRALDWKKPIATDFFSMEKNMAAGNDNCFSMVTNGQTYGMCIEPFSAATTKRPHRAISIWF